MAKEPKEERPFDRVKRFKDLWESDDSGTKPGYFGFKPDDFEQNLGEYDLIVVNSSGGKDSTAMLVYVVACAEAAGVKDRVIVAHADLGEHEWEGVAELAEKQAKIAGVPFYRVKSNSSNGDLIQSIRDRADTIEFGALQPDGTRKKKAESKATKENAAPWPDQGSRYCTSYLKRQPIGVLITELKDKAAHQRGLVREGYGISRQGLKRRVRVLNCMGMRALESPKRKQLPELIIDTPQRSNTVVRVDTWHPIHKWTAGEKAANGSNQVWDVIRAAGMPSHRVYREGFSRLSCRFCVFMPRKMLLLSGWENPKLLARFAQLEHELKLRGFKKWQVTTDKSYAEIYEALKRGERPTGEALKEEAEEFDL